MYQIWKREILLVDDEDNEVVMPRENQIPGDFFKKGDTVRAVVSAVEMKNNNLSGVNRCPKNAVHFSQQ